ncbi:MAG TPA: hypothetical protein VGS80_25445, partial [Ktedonobacterales bacterium]|nr:hypothetical protein [Ktedonobacterales bacterium]
MAVDWLHSCGVTLATLVAGSDQLFPIRWYRCNPGAQPLPYWTAYGHPAWEDRSLPVEGPQVYLHPLRWRKCAYPAAGDGLTPVGDSTAFADGLAVVGPIPLDVCGVPCIAGDGGAGLAGDGWIALEISASAPCLCGAAETAVSVGPALTSSACACASPGTSSAAGPALTSSACACGTATTTATLPTINEPWWGSAYAPPQATPSGGSLLGLAYDSGTGTWRGTSGGGTLVWAGTAAGSSPSGYWGALTW